VAVHELPSKYIQLLLQRCSEPNRVPGRARFNVFGGDPSIDMLYDHRYWKTTIDESYNLELIRVWLRILQAAVPFGRMKSFFFPIVLSQTVVFYYTFDPSTQFSLEKQKH